MRDGGEANDRKYSSVDDGETVTVPAVVSFFYQISLIMAILFEAKITS